ncbi:MAG: hypothetical protein ACOC44_13925 [Promethearchaeia archaeon]
MSHSGHGYVIFETILDHVRVEKSFVVDGINGHLKSDYNRHRTDTICKRNLHFFHGNLA